jgi:hypothetical protein
LPRRFASSIGIGMQSPKPGTRPRRHGIDVKEMPSLRDRWAHASVDEFSNDDVYRDLDTIQRFAMIIDARDTLIEEQKA